jgi:transposase
MNQTLINQAISWREGRRLRAYELRQLGWQQHRIATALGVSDAAVSQWLKSARKGGGIAALRRHPAPGRPPLLTEAQRQELPKRLAQGAEAFGFRGEVWTLPRVAQLIKDQFGVAYSSVHAGRLLRKLGWSRQQPVVRATQRQEAAIEQWQTERWPALKKGRSKMDKLSSS